MRLGAPLSDGSRLALYGRQPATVRQGAPYKAPPMYAFATKHKGQIAKLCRRYNVERLEIFGSAMRDDFDPARSDLDFLVAFSAAGKKKAFDNFFGLREGLHDLFNRRIDLITADQLKNPHLRDSIDPDRKVLYAA